MSDKIATVINGDKKITLNIGAKLSDATEKTPHPCAGYGKCGKCKVIASGELSPLSDTEKKHLSNEEIESGVRLACCTYIEGDCTVNEYSGTESAEVLLDSRLADGLKCDLSGFGIAIDIGTTTLAAKLFDDKGSELSVYGELNPEYKFGADVISRIEAAMGGSADDIALIIREALDRIVRSLSDSAGVDPSLITSLVITGNTAMLYLLTKTDTEPLSHAPFEAPVLFGKEFSPSELGLYSLPEGARIYLPRCMSAFVGADTTCALLASGICERDETAILTDIGTNGETALWNHGSLSVCSSAAGPAFEGALISMGMRGEKGAIDKVEYDGGAFNLHVIGECAPKGICGSGLVDAVASLLKSEILDESGYLEDDEVNICDSVSITQKDIRMVQLAKSAICAGIVTLIKNEKLGYADLSALYVAGGFGSYLNIENAAYIGLIPGELSEKVSVIGNAALTGASMLLLDSTLREKAESLAKMSVTFNLAESDIFSDEYMNGMMFDI